jgi:predicted small lipoprotein YifL
MESLFYRSLGLELSGPRTQRTTVAVIDHYPQSTRLVLSDLINPETGSDDPDESVKNQLWALTSQTQQFTGCGVHAPLSLPPALEQKNKVLSSAQISKLPEVKWMNEMWKKIKDRPGPFVPYLHRPAEIWLRYKAVERFGDVMSFSTNGAALAARMQYLKHQIPGPLNEVFPRAILKRISESLGVRNFVHKKYTDLEHGITAREEFLIQLGMKMPQLFLYEKDVEKMVLGVNYFNAFLCAFMQHLIHRKECENPPKGYPAKASWIYIPRIHTNWDKVF